MAKMIDIPPVWLMLALGLTWAQSRVWPIGPHVDSPVLRGLVFVLLGAAALLTGLAVWAFHRHRTSIIPHQTPSALITTGIFARTRNPIYLADVLILLAAIVYFQAWPSILLLVLFIIWIDRHFIQTEEARMHAAFGAEFSDYARNVRRWL